MAAYCQVYDSRHLQADCQEPGSAPEPYTRQSSIGYLFNSAMAGLSCGVIIGGIVFDLSIHVYLQSRCVHTGVPLEPFSDLLALISIFQFFDIVGLASGRASCL